MPGTPGEAPVQRARWLTQLRDAGSLLLDLIFPPRCAGCGRVGVLLCEQCLARFEPIRPPVCRRCGHPNPHDGLCRSCEHTPSPLDGISAAAVFAPPLRDVIHVFKYGNGRGLAPALARPMVTAWQATGLAVDLIAPVPLHAARLAERGYNQSALLARALGPAVGVPVAETLLARQKATVPQVTLGAQERRENVSGAFVCRGDVAGKRILLIDDVCTTGATLEASAAALKACGVGSVWALTLARARWAPGHSDDALTSSECASR